MTHIIWADISSLFIYYLFFHLSMQIGGDYFKMRWMLRGYCKLFQRQHHIWTGEGLAWGVSTPRWGGGLIFTLGVDCSLAGVFSSPRTIWPGVLLCLFCTFAHFYLWPVSAVRWIGCQQCVYGAQAWSSLGLGWWATWKP